MKLQTLVFVAAFNVFGASADAQTCGKLCDYEFWQKSSPNQIRQEISNADVHARYQNGSTVLSWAAILGGAEHLKSLLNAGADVHARYDRGKTALMVAALRETPDNMAVLLGAGADVHARDERGRTTLSMAAGWGSAENIELLIEEGADVHRPRHERHDNFDVRSTSRIRREPEGADGRGCGCKRK